MSILDGIKKVMSNSNYLIVFGYLMVGFTFVFFLTWNFAYFPSFIIRWENWTPINLFFWIAISFLSSLVLTLEIYNIKNRLSSIKGGGILAVIPAFFISGCSTCVPLLFSFASSTVAIGFALAEIGLVIQICTSTILLITGLYISNVLGKCEACAIENSQKDK